MEDGMISEATPSNISVLLSSRWEVLVRKEASEFLEPMEDLLMDIERRDTREELLWRLEAMLELWTAIDKGKLTAFHWFWSRK